jgi:hypothetical protein
MCALALGAAGLNLLAVIFHTRGNVKAESVVTTLESTVSDVETALPAGKAAVIAVIVKDVEAEIEKVAPNSAAVAAMVRLKAVLKAAGLVGLLTLLSLGCTGYDAAKTAIEASNAASQVEMMAATKLRADCVEPMSRLSDPTVIASLDKTCKPKADAYAVEYHAHLLVIDGLTKMQAAGKITLSDLLGLVRDLDAQILTLTTELAK